jgi:hypothetical protein
MGYAPESSFLYFNLVELKKTGKWLLLAMPWPPQRCVLSWRCPADMPLGQQQPAFFAAF